MHFIADCSDSWRVPANWSVEDKPVYNRDFEFPDCFLNQFYGAGLAMGKASKSLMNCAHFNLTALHSDNS